MMTEQEEAFHPDGVEYMQRVQNDDDYPSRMDTS